MDYSRLKKPFFALAPMDDVTDTVFRQIVADCAKPDLFFTEFVNVDALQSAGRENSKRRLLFTAKDTPLIAQIWGKNPDNFYKTAKEIADGSLAQELGLPDGINFAGIDLNMGCPAKNEVQNGVCSALILNKPLAKQITDATKQGVKDSILQNVHGRDKKIVMQVSVKTRLGYNNVDESWWKFLLEQKLSMLTMHGRTKKQMSKVPADWKQIGILRQMRDELSPDTLIVGNGDVENRQQGEKLAKQYKLDGIMIGRGVFRDPFVFAKKTPWAEWTTKQKKELYANHVKLFAKTWKNNERKLVTLNKFCKIYINGFDGAKELREQLMIAQTADELLKTLN